MDKRVLFNTAMLPLSGLQRHAASLVTIHRGHFLPASASHGFPHPCLWAGRQHFAQENTLCSFSPLERGLQPVSLQRDVTPSVTLPVTTPDHATLQQLITVLQRELDAARARETLLLQMLSQLQHHNQRLLDMPRQSPQDGPGATRV